MIKQKYKKVFKFQKETGTNLSMNDERPISSSTNRSKNSFLVEIDHNYDIDRKIRTEIEAKYKKSEINAKYKFPRASINESKGLPKIKFERRNLSENESLISTVDINRSKLKHNITRNRENSIGENYKIPSINNKKIEKEKKHVLHSVTPSLYVKSLRKDAISIHDIKRSTPSPAPRGNGFSLRVEKNSNLYVAGRNM